HTDALDNGRVVVEQFHDRAHPLRQRRPGLSRRLVHADAVSRGRQEIGDAVAHQAAADHADVQGFAHPAVNPPSTYMIWPVPESGESRSPAMPIRSSTSPRRPSGMRESERARVCWPSWSSPYIQAVSLERKTVGAMALTVMPCFAHSVASTRVSESVAPLEAQ